MLISNKPEIIKADFSGDNMIVVHGQETYDIQEEAHLIRKYSDNGFTEGRTMRHIARIPELVFAQHPEFNYDTKALMDWLKNEGSCYRTVDGGI